MPIETILSIVNLAVSIAGLFTSIKSKSRLVVILTVFFAAVFVISASSLALNYQHAQKIKGIQVQITSTLKNRTLTFQRIYEQLLPPPSLSDANEALLGLVEKGIVQHKIIEFRYIPENSWLATRGYYLRADR